MRACREYNTSIACERAEPDDEHPEPAAVPHPPQDDDKRQHAEHDRRQPQPEGAVRAHDDQMAQQVVERRMRVGRLAAPKECHPGAGGPHWR